MKQLEGGSLHAQLIIILYCILFGRCHKEASQ